MYPFSIRSSIPLRSNVDREELHALLMQGFRNRKIIRIKKDFYQLVEPVSWFGSSESAFIHEITIHEHEVVFNSHTPVRFLIPALFTVSMLGFFLKSGLIDNDWNYGLLVLIPIPVFIMLVWSSLPYFFTRNHIKELKRRILSL